MILYIYIYGKKTVDKKEMKLLISPGSTFSFSNNKGYDYTKDAYISNIIVSTTNTKLDEIKQTSSINNLYTGINIITIDLTKFNKQKTFKFNLSLRFIKEIKINKLEKELNTLNSLTNMITLNGNIEKPLTLNLDSPIFMNGMSSLNYQPINIKTSRKYITLILVNCNGTFNFNFNKVNKCLGEAKLPSLTGPLEKTCEICIKPNYTFYQGSIVTLVLVVFSIIIYNMLNKCED